MSKLRNISREGWMVFTAVLAAIAVIAAMVTVPAGKAEAAEPTDFKPNTTLGENTGKAATDTSWGPLVWAGAPIEGQTGKNYEGHPENNVGWGWCMDPSLTIPMHHKVKYDQADASKLEIPEGYRDAAINVARKLKAATARGDKKAAANYSVYLVALVAPTGTSKAVAAATITGRDPYYASENPDKKNYPGFTGSAEEFTQLTGYKIVSDFDPAKFEKDPGVTIPAQPQDAFITIVIPPNKKSGPAQPVMPVDQPGLPNDGGGHDTPGTDTPGTDTPGTDTPGTDTPGTDTPGTDTPGTDTPGTDTPGTDTPGTDTPGTDTPGTDTPGTDTPGTDTPGTDTPGTDTPGTDTPGTDTPGTDTPGTDTPGTDTPGTDTPGTDTPGTDTPGTDTPGTDTPGTDTPGTDTPGTDTPAEPAPEKPKISTNADFEDGSHEVVAGAKIVDEVS
ncbi:adhesin, partial [Corynebacterium tuberculostearicum]|nr:adhesin [Corynebacterium tuberculostearicum]